MLRHITWTVVLMAWANASCAHDASLPVLFERHTLEQVSKRIYVVHGTQALPSPKSRGFMNNPAAILTDHGVIIVDPGSSAEIGKQLLTKIRKISDKPVIAIFNTHVHGDHWLGNQGVRERYPAVPIYAHVRMIERIRTGEGENWVKLLTGMTQGATAGTQVIVPSIGLKGGEELQLDGVTLKIHHTGHAHTDHDLMIEVVEDKSLFFGDIVASKRVPHSDVPQDANFKGSIVAIQTLLKRPIDVYIPGHGHSGGRDVPESTLHFLKTLYASVTKYFNQGLQSYEMKDRVIADLKEFKEWNNFNEMGRVINFVYQEVEREQF